MRILILTLLFVLLALDYSMAERPGAVSSKSYNRSRSYNPNRSSKHNQSRNFGNKNYKHNNSINKFNYYSGQQSYLNPYYLRNGYNPDILDPGHQLNKHYQRDKFPNYYDYYPYTAYNYPYYYDYGYDSSYYESDYPDNNSYERDTLQQRDKDINMNQFQESQPKNYDDFYYDAENYDLQYYDAQYKDEEAVDTVIYKWTDGEGIEHYTNNLKKIPDKFKDTIIELETW